MEQSSPKIEQLVQRHGASREALVEILRDLSQEAGYLDRETMAAVAKRLGLPLSKVYGVASFYSLISVKPLGRHIVNFCQDAPCHVAGGAELWELLQLELGIPFGETTPDGQWSLQTVSCVGACAVGPVMLVDGEIYGNLTPEKVREILARYRAQDAGGAV